jgi:predicted DNA-binding transcriptional regulator AlpA
VCSVITDLLTEVEAARVLGLATTTLRRWRQIGRGPRWAKVGPAAVRYDLRELERYIERNTHTSTRDALPPRGRARVDRVTHT